MAAEKGVQAIHVSYFPLYLNLRGELKPSAYRAMSVFGIAFCGDTTKNAKQDAIVETNVFVLAIIFTV